MDYYDIFQRPTHIKRNFTGNKPGKFTLIWPGNIDVIAYV